MITIAISLLFGFAAFVALLCVTICVARGMAHARSILVELAQLDAATGRKVKSQKRPAISQSGQARNKVLSPLQQPLFAAS